MPFLEIQVKGFLCINLVFEFPEWSILKQLQCVKIWNIYENRNCVLILDDKKCGTGTH
jgi:hypothetical protein